MDGSKPGEFLRFTGFELPDATEQNLTINSVNQQQMVGWIDDVSN